MARNTIVYVIRKDRPRDLGIFGFDFLLPDEARLRKDDGCYETAIDAERAAEKRFKAFRLTRVEIADVFVICTQRRHILATEFLAKSLGDNGEIATLDMLKQCPIDCRMELSFIVRGLV